MEINVESVTTRNPQNHSQKQKEFSQMITVMDYLVNNDISTREGLRDFNSYLSGALSLHIKHIKSSTAV